MLRKALVLVLLAFSGRPSPGAAASFDFSLGSYGPHTVTQGYPLYFGIEGTLLSGSPTQIYLSVSGLPPGSKATFPDLKQSCCKDAEGNFFSWDTTFKTAVRLKTGSATPGSYSVTVTASGGGVTRSVTYPFTVVAPQGPFVPASSPPPGPIPELAAWESNMTGYGAEHCNQQQIVSGGTWEGYVWYYDGIRVYYQIASYTGDPSWSACASYVRQLYRDQYVIPSGGKVPGYRIFPHGLLKDYRRTGDVRSKEAAVDLAQNAAFAASQARLWDVIDFTRSREVAYSIDAYLIAETLGEPRHPNLQPYVEIALGHIDQWSISKNARFVQPFMVALTAEALISYWEKTADPRVVPAIRKVMNWIWNHTWDAGAEAFLYSDRPTDDSSETGPAPDLNLLIAPAFAWLYRQTGDLRFVERGDQVFAGGVRHAWLGGGKQFSQSYRWSFSYLKWRNIL